MFRIAVAAVGLIAAAAVVRVALVRDRGQPARIDGPSMAPALVGRHVRLMCEDCRFPLRIDAGSLPRDGYAVCPQCGFQANLVRRGRETPGDRVRIDRTRWDRLGPCRWGVVAVRHPDRPDRQVVKRIAGLPGERLAIRDGELYADGHLLVKSLAEFHQMAVLVHDADYRPPPEKGLPARWSPDRPDGDWQAVELDQPGADRNDRPPRMVYRFTAPGRAESSATPLPAAESDSGESAAELQWLRYEHWPGLPPPARRTQPSPVRDNYGYNQNVSRPLNLVSDLVLDLRLTVRRPGKIVLRYDDGHVVMEAELFRSTRAANSTPGASTESWDDETAFALRVDGVRVSDAHTPHVDYDRGIPVEFGRLDGRFILSVDGRTIFSVDELGEDARTMSSFAPRKNALSRSERRQFSEVSFTSSPTPFSRIQPEPPPDDAERRRVTRPFAIGARSGDFDVSELRIWRDLYFLHGWQTAEPWEMDAPLAADEIFVLGDNCPVARDSRNWRHPGVPLRNVLGYVVPDNSPRD